MTKKKSKNGRVELLRFLFAMMILLFHIEKRFGPVKHFFNHGYIGVEFFFLVSGYLLAAGCYSKRAFSTELIGSETAGMIWKKLANIFPYHLYAIVLTIGVNAYFLFDSTKERLDYVLKSWASIFFIQIFGFDSTWVNKLTWYLDVWLVVTFIFYIFLRKHYDIFVKIVCPIMALFILGYLDHEYGKLADIDTWTGLFYKCFLRGTAEMALGCSAYSLTRRVNKEEFSKAGHVVLGLLEAIGYGIVVLYACGDFSTHYEFPVLFVMMGALILTFSQINPCEKIFTGKIYDWFGKMSLLIYLNQFYSIRFVQQMFADSSFLIKTLLSVVITIVGAVLCEFVVDTIVKLHPLSRLLLLKKEA